MVTVSSYHQRSKHSLQRYAAAPETLDWDDQPDPFRRFEGCTLLNLPKPGRKLAITWAELDSFESITVSEFNLANVSLLLELSFGLSAWKQFGPDKWALRCNPSSGNLHPTEVYVINGNAGLMQQGVYHYVSYDHVLEQRCSFKNKDLQGSVLVGLSSIHWREAWKYGERAYRYCQLDIGHALAALSYAAATLGWRVELKTNYSDLEISQVLGLDATEQFIDKEFETPDLVCRIHCKDKAFDEMDSEKEKISLLQTLKESVWQGKAQSLGAYHVYHWPVIDEVSLSAQKTQVQQECWQTESLPVIKSSCSIPASEIIRNRRSAQRFDAKSCAMKQQSFFRIFASLLPSNTAPFAAWNWPPAIHLCLFIHKVEGLAPGLYCLPRSVAGFDSLKKGMSDDFEWKEVQGFNDLFLLHECDARQIAKTLSCHQSIASDSAFSLAMLSDFNTNVTKDSWNYRRLFWECGLLGQILYLEAEAAGLRGTGIGCFFDDDVHGLYSIEDDSLQSLYHFTVGVPIDDPRLQTLSAYDHLV